MDVELCRLAQEVVDELRSAGLCVITAESCTGGLLAGLLSCGPGASECFGGGFTVYTKTQKTTALGIDAGLLERETAVSALVAAQMARNALARSAANVAISITGVLGPDPDEDGNPPGLVYFGVTTATDQVEVTKKQFPQQDPDDVRHAVLVEALQLLKLRCRR